MACLCKGLFGFCSYGLCAQLAASEFSLYMEFSHTYTYTSYCNAALIFLIMCPLKAISLKGGVHVCNSVCACERRCQLCFGGRTGLFHMRDGGFYVTVGLTRTYHLFITLEQINSVSCHLLPNIVIFPFAWSVGGVSGAQTCWIKSNCWNMMNSDKLRGFNPNLYVLPWMAHMCVIQPCYIDYKHVLCNLLRHVKHQNKPFATSSFSVNDILGNNTHCI